ncbi:dTDP-4-keto-L-rhamnose reductase RmlD [Streptococcus pneumoniae]|nr:dTDP-4-keto-L-rhamnose reductase RmlD [Streptococcus pneumoniae]
MILITGANGQLGTELRYLLDERNVDYVAVDVTEMDITNSEMVEKVFAEVKPTLVYHCAAYTAVDAAEDEGKELDFAINVTGRVCPICTTTKSMASSLATLNLKPSLFGIFPFIIQLTWLMKLPQLTLMMST